MSPMRVAPWGTVTAMGPAGSGAVDGSDGGASSATGGRGSTVPAVATESEAGVGSDGGAGSATAGATTGADAAGGAGAALGRAAASGILLCAVDGAGSLRR